MYLFLAATFSRFGRFSRKRNCKEAEDEEKNTKDKGDVGAIVRLIRFTEKKFDRRFLVATKRLYMRVCPSVRPSVGR